MLCVCVLLTEVAAPWTEDTVRQCLFLYLSLLPLNHRLVHELASVYTEAIADIKRSVLRAIEQPVSPHFEKAQYFILLKGALCSFGEEILMRKDLHLLIFMPKQTNGFLDMFLCVQMCDVVAWKYLHDKIYWEQTLDYWTKLLSISSCVLNQFDHKRG